MKKFYREKDNDYVLKGQYLLSFQKKYYNQMPSHNYYFDSCHPLTLVEHCKKRKKKELLCYMRLIKKYYKD